LLVRGISCLIAGVPNKTQNITVRSIVGRFLEHHRIYMFGSGDDAKVYISSADFMTRNTLKRVEIGVPVMDSGIKKRIMNIFDLMMRDNVKARLQHPDGTYYHAEVRGEEEINSQEQLYAEAYENAPKK